MKQTYTKWIQIIAGLGWLLFGTSALWAGDCSGPDDCKAPPDNSSKAVVIVSIFAGAGLAFRSLNRSNGNGMDNGEPSSLGSDANSESGPGPLETKPSTAGGSAGPGSGPKATDRLGALGEDGPGGSGN